MNEQNRLKSVSDLFKGAFEQYKKHFNTLVPIMLVAGIGMYFQSLFMFLGGSGRNVNATYALLALVAAVVYIIGMIWGTTAIVNQIHKMDQKMTLKQAFMAAKPFIWPMVITGFFAGLFTVIGLILLVIPGIIIGVWLSFSLYIVIAENKSGMDALKASKEYVKGYWWSVFGRLIVIGVAVAVASAIVGAIGGAIFGIEIGTLLQNISSLVLTPLALLYQYALYLDVKRVKSGGSAPMHQPEVQAPTDHVDHSATPAV